MSHEPECFSETDRDVCICDLLKTAYQRGLSDAAACIEAEFPKPTLGIQRAIRILREMADA